MLDDIVEYARLEHGVRVLRLRPVPLDAVLADLELQLQPRFQEAGLHYARAASGLSVLGDPERLRQALQHLLLNALAFTPAGGEVRVDLRREGDRVLLRVSDTGVGIEADQRQHIFEPFVQRTMPGARRSGAGLGLALARRLARLMDGELTADGVPGRGSVFTLSLRAA